MKRNFITIVILCMAFLSANAQRVESLIRDWRFSHADDASQSTAEYDDAKWEKVCVPHDWAIAGPFDKEIDKQVVAIVQNGEKEATEKTGRSGSLPWIGVGWYRTHVSISPDTERAVLNFDGAMAEPVVYVNGHKAGEWKYGYNAFNIDITPYVNRGGLDNVIAVRLQNVEESSRWYPGAGLYRPVKLILSRKDALKEWSVTATTQSILSTNKEGLSTVNCLFAADVIAPQPTKAERKAGVKANKYQVRFAVLDAKGDTLAKCHQGVKRSKDCDVAGVRCAGNVKNVKLWSPEQPALYTLSVDLIDANTGDVIDNERRKIGFRTLEYSAAKGFALNGVSRKFKGVCLHHDLGMIGAAVNRSAIVRQIELLKSMGCDAIRTSHNMPSQMQMDVCDSLGMMVMAESFDMWVYPKCKNGYARFFNDCPENEHKTWAEKDIENLVLANRNHPSIVMWSIGNEIPEQGMEDGPRIVRMLQNVVHDNDPDRGRQVTTGMDNIDNALRTGFAQVIDIPGLNYRTQKYDAAYSKLGHGFVLGSETASTVSSRGVYKFNDSLTNPVERLDNHAYDDGQCSSYDLEACWWANIPEDDWILQDDRPWVIGEFVWTGFDYLGEPTPYDEYWPSRSSYFGIFDLAGLPKDRYYLYRSRWNKNDETIHLLPHWTWKGREGKVTPVYCYTSYPTAELFVNGKSQGKISKKIVHRNNIEARTTSADDELIDRYRLRWNDVVYEPGELKVVVYDATGKVCGTKVLKTAGKASAIQLSGDMGESVKWNMDKGELTFITVSVVDKDGNLCPDADNQVSVAVKGGAKFRGICNGDATSLESFVRPTMKAFHGQLVFAVESLGNGKPINITVTAKGLPSTKIDR